MAKYTAPSATGVGATVEISEIESLAKGVIIAGDGSGAPASLSPGGNDAFLVYDSAQSAGLKSQTPAQVKSILAIAIGDLTDLSAAVASGVNTGTATDEYITPDALAGSNVGRRPLGIAPFKSSESVVTGDGEIGLPITPEYNGMEVVDVIAFVHTKGITGATDVQIRRRRAGVNADVLSTKVTVGDEFYARDGVINTSNDDLATGDMLYVDVDAVHSGTAPLGLTVVIICRLP